MTNGDCIYCEAVDYMSRMALQEDDFRRFSVIWEFRVTRNWVAARVASRFGNGPLRSCTEGAINLARKIPIFFVAKHYLMKKNSAKV